MEKYKRIFVIVMDSLGVGAMDDSPEFGDVGVNTLGHISQSVDSFCMPNLQKMGMANLTPLKQVEPVGKSIGYYGKLNEKSRGKDTMTGHWEMMGLEVTKPFKTFTEHGFPPELIAELGTDSIVLLSTHIISDVEQIAGRILMVRDGQLIFDGGPGEIRQDLERFYLDQFEG